MQCAPPDYSDTQGLARFRFRTLTEACFFLLKIEKASLACSWLARAPVTTAVELSQPPDTALQVALTSTGLRAMGVPDEVLNGFSAEFISGMAGEDSRSRRLGDIGDNAPFRWQWGGEGAVPHALVMLYAKPDHFAARKATVQQEIREGGFSIQTCLATSDLGGVEPFGFTDGISQPAIDWNRERALTGEDQLEYGNLLALGELLLGYPNEYGKYTDRPLLARQQQSLPPAEDNADKVDLGRNGTYLVFRQLRQDVRGFWRYLCENGSSLEEGRRLAQAMVGRSMSGAPLVPPVEHPIAGIGKDATSKQLNGFTYDADSYGAQCPLGAHIRRANPRNGDLPGRSRGTFSRLIRMLGFARGGVRDDALASARFHR